MATRRQQPDATHAGGPQPSRPRLPRDYGVAADTKGLLPWSHVTERMANAQHYWICTVNPDGQPHATPVDGIWLDERLYFGGSPETRRQRNLAANPRVSVHLESASDVVILQGDARSHRPDHALAVRLAEASSKKYGYSPTPEQYQQIDVTIFAPRVVFAWTNLPKDATRFTVGFADGS